MVDKVIILDFGSQYTQLIARRVRELNVYSEIMPFNALPEDLAGIAAVILSGSPFSVRDDNALQPDLEKIYGKLPILGICYGAQYIAQQFGGAVARSDKREYGKAELETTVDDPIFEAIPQGSQVWMSHGDTIEKLPDDFKVLARTESIPIAAFKSNGKYSAPVYCLQFHPEVTHTLYGSQLLRNFLIEVAGVSQDWTPANFIHETVETLQLQLGNDKVLMALSGGVDSTVGAELIHRAIGDRLYCFFIDNGLLRKNEYEQVLHWYEDLGLNIHGIDARQQFWDALKGVTDPEQKRKIIGRLFIEIFEKESNAHPEIKWLGQGTIYPDVIESVSVHGPSVTIKSHHNVGGLPETLKLKMVEPLRMLFKDEVRKVGLALGIPERILNRHPFPGPGLGIRILGEITPEKVRVLQEADAIFISILKENNLYDKIWQAGAILLPVRSVGVMGDERTYEQTVALRAVTSTDGMTAEWSKIPYEILAKISNTIINQVKGINRVVYDISTKPPATIEWE